jgi:periplasmic copper chaperone A
MIRSMLVGALALVFAGAADARVHAWRMDSLTLDNFSVAASFNGAKTTEASLNIWNAGRVPDRLVSASCACAQSVELHHMWMDHGVMRMRVATGGIEIPAGETVKLTKDGDHLMLIGLKRPLKAGQRVKITLRFLHNGAATLGFPVVDTTPAAPMHMKM